MEIDLDDLPTEGLQRPFKASFYEKQSKIGEGTYAVVYQGIIKATKRKIAIKKIKLSSQQSYASNGMDLSALREIKSLQELSHPNIVELIDVYAVKSNLNLVLEWLETDLEKLIKDKSVVMTRADIKSWMAMMLKGVEFCHKNWILHRDLKPNNLLIAPDGKLKLADFGLAREFGSPGVGMTSMVVTRSPELLFGSREYTGSVDIWACGCIFAELMLRTPYMAGETDLEQLRTIFKALGTPTSQEWPLMTQLPNYVTFQETYPKNSLSSLFTAADKESLDLLSKMLTFDPSKRITANQALCHPYFASEPAPTYHEKLPKSTIMPEKRKAEMDSIGLKPKRLF